MAQGTASLRSGIPREPARIPAHAGTFYPREAHFLARLVDDCLDAGQARAPSEWPKAVIAPHAGYIYSGPVAGTAFAPWKSNARDVRRVILIGPSHYYDFPGLALPESTRFATPLGEIPIHPVADRIVSRETGVRVFDAPHQPEHALEVELPFIQRLFDRAAIVPLLVGRADAARVASVLDALWGGDETVIVISSDLSHYHDYETARRIDANTARAIQQFESVKLTGDQACGYRAIRGFLEAARHRDLQCVVSDLRNSGDTVGGTDQVVGYGAFHFVPNRS